MAKLASAENLLETSQKNLMEAETRCQSLEASVGDQEAAAAAAREDASERTSYAGERVSTLEGEACSLREEVMFFSTIRNLRKVGAFVTSVPPPPHPPQKLARLCTVGCVL